MATALRHVPTARIPLRRASPASGVLGSVMVHVAILAFAFGLGRGVFATGGGPGGAGPLGGGGGRGGGAPRLTFFELPTVAPAQADLPPAPRIIPPPVVVPTDLPLLPVEIPREALSPAQPATTASTTGPGTPGSGGGSGGGQGQTVGPGSGPGQGPGTGGDGGYIFPASPRWTIIPPANAPSDLRGRRLRVRFWVTADGRVTRVEVEPAIRDGAYRREFLERMREYLFVPATTRDGQRVASVTEIVIMP